MDDFRHTAKNSRSWCNTNTHNINVQQQLDTSDEDHSRDEGFPDFTC